MARIDRAALRQKIQELEGLSDDERAALLQLAAEVRSYGLVWEDRVEEVEERLREELPVLVEDASLRIIGQDVEHELPRIGHESADNNSREINGNSRENESPNHILIEGDNLEALTALSYTHEGRVDVIYIDPPYNTGNRDFVYNDSFVDSEDSYRHSKWLSFMSKRLRIAKRLLSDRGVIFISIDDNEQANLKLLCDQVFGEDKFVANIIWQKNYASKNNSQGIPAATEYLLTYSKLSDWTPNRLARTEEMDSKYKNPDNDESPWRSDNPCAPGAISHQGMVYAIQHPFTGEFLYPYNGACWRYQQDDLLEIMNGWCKYELKDLNDDDIRAKICGISAEKVRKGVKGIVLTESLEDSKLHAEMILHRGQWPKYYFTKNGKGGIARKTYLTNVEGRMVTSFWPYTEVNHTDGAKKELKDIFNSEIPFDTPKPVDLLKRIAEVASQPTSTVLDFFAGSGTTLHAVMQLNKEDGGHRQCILVTNNENNICREVTYERNKRVIEGYTTPKGVQVEGLHENNLRYYRTRLLPRERTNKNMRALVGAATDLLCIKEGLYEEWKVESGKWKVGLTQKDFRVFSDSGRAMMVVYNEESIPDIVDWLQTDANVYSLFTNHSSPIKVYVFSPGAYAWDDDFAPVLDRVELCALPEAIYQAYKNVLPKKRRPGSVTSEAEKGGEE